MIEDIRGIETKPYLVALNEIKIPKYSKSDFSKSKLRSIKSVNESLKSWKFNFSLPIVCLSEDKGKYELLTGLPIYQASVDAEIQRIWVFLVAAQRSETDKIVEEFLIQSKLNEVIFELTDDDIEEFLSFINNKNSILKRIPGVGDVFANQIAAGRPYETKEQLQEVGGKNRSINWIKAFKQADKTS
ncbi:MAG: hypothetical protein KME27_00515 [Lyngbya sp. HA4199-MV5]|nr:hypothetical protein [Lyngbya sp. HA4199-MV5]